MRKVLIFIVIVGVTWSGVYGQAVEKEQKNAKEYSEGGDYFRKYVGGIALNPGFHFFDDDYRSDVFKAPMLKGGIKFSGAPLPYLVIEFNPWGYYNETGKHDLYGGGFDGTVIGKAPTTLPINPFGGFGISYAKMRTEERGLFHSVGEDFTGDDNNHKTDWSGVGWHFLLGTEIYAHPIFGFSIEFKYTSHKLSFTHLDVAGGHSYDSPDELPEYYYNKEAYENLNMGGWDFRFGINFHFGPRS